MSATNPTSGAKTFYLDDELWNAAKAYAGKHPRVRSVSSLIARLLAKEIRAKGRAYGVKLPERFSLSTSK